MAVVNNLKTIRESRGLLQEDIASATGFERVSSFV